MSEKEKEEIAGWEAVLDNYEYPERPCDTLCFDKCPARPSCPLYQAWESRTKRDKDND